MSVHTCLTRVAGAATRVVTRAPPSSGQHSAPRLLRMEGGLRHPIVRTDMYEVEVSEVTREVFKRHPATKQTISKWATTVFFDVLLNSTLDNSRHSSVRQTESQPVRSSFVLTVGANWYTRKCTPATHQNSPSFLTLMLRSSLSLVESPSHSQDRSLHGPVHSPRPHGLRSLTRGVSPRGPRTRARPVTL